MAIASAVPDKDCGGGEQAEVLTATETTLNDAQIRLEGLLIALGKTMRERGHEIVDIEDE